MPEVPKLTKVVFFLDSQGNVFQKATSKQAAENTEAIRATVNDKKAFYVPTTLEALAKS